MFKTDPSSRPPEVKVPTASAAQEHTPSPAPLEAPAGWTPSPAAAPGPAVAPSRFIAPVKVTAPEPTHQSAKTGRTIGFMKDEDLRAAPREKKLEMMKTLLAELRFAPSIEPDEAELMRQAVGQLVLGTTTPGELDYLLGRVNPGEVKSNLSGKERLKALKHIETLQQPTPGDWAGYRTYLEQVTGAKSSGKNSLDCLVDGAEFSPKALEVLGAAAHSINLSVFQLQPDDVGQKVVDVLCERAKAGLKVRVLLDEVGTMEENVHKSKAMIAQLRAAGAEVIVKKASLFKDHLDHRKLMVVDGGTAFTGGMNIGRFYQREWHDQQTLVRGPAVGELQEAFFQHWSRAGGQVPEGAELQKNFQPQGEFEAGSETYVVKHQGDKQDRNIKAAYLKAIGTAEQSITVANPYFSDADIIEALCRAAHRGVKVKIVLPAQNDMDIVKRASRASYPELLKAGVEIYEYQGRMAHEKVAVIDGKWATVGSSNLDARSLEYNDEMNLVVLDERFAGELQREMFDKDIAQSTRVTDAHPSIRDRLSRLLSPYI